MTSLFEQMVRLFRRFPGIGTRQATRFAYFILQQDDAYVRELIDTMTRTRKHMRLCTESFQFFYDDDATQTTSPIVRDPNRMKSQLMIVLKDMDLQTIEKSNVYHGQYFVLGGLAPMIDTDDIGDMRLSQLLSLIRQRAPILKEIIMALPLNTEGEYTRQVVSTKIEPLLKEFNITLSTLGRGLSTGSELEYIDRDTFESAWEGRK